MKNNITSLVYALLTVILITLPACKDTQNTLEDKGLTQVLSKVENLAKAEKKIILFDIVHNGRTIGKLILGIFVVSKKGEVLNTRRHLLRSLYKMWSVLMLPVAVLLFVLDEYTIQDYCTGTRTIRAGKMLNKS